MEGTETVLIFLLEWMWLYQRWYSAVIPLVVCACEQMWFNSGSFHFCVLVKWLLCANLWASFLLSFAFCTFQTLLICLLLCPNPNFFYQFKYLTCRLVWLHSQRDPNSLLSTKHPFSNHVGLLAWNRIGGPEKDFLSWNCCIESLQSSLLPGLQQPLTTLRSDL